MILNITFSTMFKLKQISRKYIRFVIYGIAYYCGIFHLFRLIANLRGQHTTILTFHRVGNIKDKKMTHSLYTSFISMGNFERILKFLLKHYRIISLTDYLNICNNKNESLKNSIIITFDDGYKDVYENGFAILKKYKIPATVFLTSAFINSNEVFVWDFLYAMCKNCGIKSSFKHLPNEIYAGDIQRRLISIFNMNKNERDPFIESLITDLQDYNQSDVYLMATDLSNRLDYDLEISKCENKMLSWEDIRELQMAGIAFGSHTRSHLFLNGSISKDKILDEMVGSKLDIENKLNSEIIAFAYPGGKISSKVKDLAMESGYKVACTQTPGINSTDEDIFALKRINIWDGTVEGFAGRFSKSLLAIQLVKNSFSRRRKM